MIYDHNCKAYRIKHERLNIDRYNGAYYYSKEIVKNIIPNVKTDRSWVTINCLGKCEDGAIVFIHNNLYPDIYRWLEDYKDLILVCGVPSTCEKVKHLGRAIYLPLSVDVPYVAQFRTEKTRKRAYVGRSEKREGKEFPRDTEFLEAMPRRELLSAIAQFEEVYAVGRCAIESIILGCRVLPFDERFPDPGFWQVVDNREAARMLQVELDRIDG